MRPTQSRRLALGSGSLGWLASLVLTAGCIHEPALILSEHQLEGGSSSSDTDGSAPGTPAGGDASTAADGAPEGDAGNGIVEVDASVPAPDSGPGPQCVASGARICCGAVACDGCVSAQSGDCAECASACAPGQLCCKRGGPPRCKTLNASCGGGD